MGRGSGLEKGQDERQYDFSSMGITAGEAPNDVTNLSKLLAMEERNRRSYVRSLSHWSSGQTSKDFVEWFGLKYDLTSKREVGIGGW
jgi:hypothetical protein